MIYKITCFVVILLVCLTIPVFAGTNGGARASIGMMFSDASGPLLNLSGKLSSQQSFNLMGSVGIGVDNDMDVTLIPVMLSIEPQPRSSNNWYFGAGLGLMFRNDSFGDELGSGSSFAYQGYAGYNFTPKMFGEFKLMGVDGATVSVISIGQKF